MEKLQERSEQAAASIWQTRINKEKYLGLLDTGITGSLMDVGLVKNIK